MINSKRIDIWHKINIIYKDKDFLILEKPSGLIVHPDKYQKDNTLVDWILDNYPEIKQVGEVSRQGLVHRLDKDVSGLMVIARNKITYQYLIDQFKAHKVKKEYLALVFGTIYPFKGVIDFSIARNKKGKLVVLNSKNLIASSFESNQQKVKNIKSAITEYEVIKEFQDFTLIKLKLLTGRTNQIRLHLKAMGCPIVGDKKYSTKESNNLVAKQKIDRIFLHAYCLGFYDSENKWREFNNELPKGLKVFIDNLRS